MTLLSWNLNAAIRKWKVLDVIRLFQLSYVLSDKRYFIILWSNLYSKEYMANCLVSDAAVW